MEWNTFYKDPHSLESFFEQLYVHSALVERVLKERPLRIIEVGVGRGTFTAFFQLLGIACTAVDKDEGVIEKYKIFARSLGLKGEARTSDAFGLPYPEKSFDIAMSQGFLEHFSDDDIHKLIDEQLRVAKKVIFSIPSKFYRIRDFGNERLLTIKEWGNILKNYEIEAMVPYHHRRLKKNLLLRRPLMYIFIVTGKKL